MSVVREEFGPTLPELVGARLRVPPRTVWRVLAAAGAVVLLVLVWLAFLRGTPGRASVVVRQAGRLQPPPHRRRCSAPRPRDGEMLRLQLAGRARAQSFAVRPLRLAPLQGRRQRGPHTAVRAPHPADERSRIRASSWRGDGRVNINKQPGYQIVFQARVGGHTTVRQARAAGGGARPAAARRASTSPCSPSARRRPRKADAVAANGPLKTPFRSLRFGTEGP